jgi:hypothetical protein
MPQLTHARSHFLRAIALTVAVLTSCEKSPFEPRGEGERVPIGQIITDEIAVNSVGRYSFVGDPDAAYTIFLEALQGRVSLVVWDSTHNFQAADLVAGPGSPPLYQNPSLNMGSHSGAVYNIRVFASPPGTQTRFRLLVYKINKSPELLAATFALGDTVAGETIDPIVDIDEFVTDGTAGQEVVFVGETPAAVGSGSVSFTLIDTVAQQFLGYVFADAGPPTLTTGRMFLPATRGCTHSSWDPSPATCIPDTAARIASGRMSSIELPNIAQRHSH